MTHTQAPSWNLNDLYQGMDDSKIQDTFIQTEASIKKIKDICEKQELDDLTADQFYECMTNYEQIEELLGRVLSYAYLIFAQDHQESKGAKFYQDMSEKCLDLSSMVLFFPLKVSKANDDVIDNLLNDPKTIKFKPWVRRRRLYKDHELTVEMEKLLQEKYIPSRQSWVRLFDETLSSARFKVGGQDLDCSATLNLMSNPDESKRKEAAFAFSKGLEQHISVFTLVFNTIIKDKFIDDSWRKYDSPSHSRHLDNDVEENVVNALVASVKKHYPTLSHRYFKLKAKVLKKSKLNYWDRNAPYSHDNIKTYSWEDAKTTVLNAYSSFSPEIAALVQKFFDHNWIDAALRSGKDSGAFSHPTVPSAHPYILMNFHGKVYDIMTLAHELGHGAHQLLSASQGALMADTPLTLAETASVFGEMLTFQYLLSQEKDPKQRWYMIAKKVEDMLNTVVRQTAFYTFEQRLHAQRKKGELSTQDICNTWMEIQKESLGDAFDFHDSYRFYWAYISHFIHSPFYVYAYAFGDCLVNSLYAVYKKQPEGFQQKYIEMLKAGGTLHHSELLKPFGLRADDPHFWDEGLSMIESFIDQLEKELP